MSLRDALAAAILAGNQAESNETKGHLCCAFDPSDLAGLADAILSDPAFREALVEAVADGLHDASEGPVMLELLCFRDYADDEDTVIGCDGRCKEVARAIVARMLEDEPTGPHPGGIEQYQEEDR